MNDKVIKFVIEYC